MHWSIGSASNPHTNVPAVALRHGLPRGWIEGGANLIQQQNLAVFLTVFLLMQNSFEHLNDSDFDAQQNNWVVFF